MDVNYTHIMLQICRIEQILMLFPLSFSLFGRQTSQNKA